MLNKIKKLTLVMLTTGLISTTAMAADKPELVIYTYDSFAAEWGPGPQIKAEFEKECNCTVTFIGLDSSIGILGRVRLEGSSSKADIVLGLDSNLMATAAATGLFTKHNIETRGKLTLPADVGYWDDELFIPYDWGHFAFNYNANRLVNPPRSFAELLKTEDLKIAIQDPRTATPGLGLMLWVNAIYGDKAKDVWPQLAPKLLTVTKGWWDSYSLFVEGEADMVLSYSTSPAYHQITENDDSYRAAEFSEGHYIQVEVAGILKSSSKPALARLFLQRLLERNIQSVIPTTNWMYPAAKSGVVPPQFDTLIKPQKTYFYSPGVVAENRKTWVSDWLNGLSQ